MSQIMRLRRIAGSDHGIDDRNNGHRHEMAFVKNIEQNGLLHEADLLPDSYGGKFHPRAVPELVSSLPIILRALQRGKVTPSKALAAQAQGLQGGQADLPRCPRSRGALRAQPLRRGRGGRDRHESRLLARLREPRLHPGAARLDGAGRAAAGHRAHRARPRLMLRRRRDRRAQPGARRHAERPHVRARPAGDRGRRRPDDEHLLDVPGRAERVSGTPGREHALPRARQ